MTYRIVPCPKCNRMHGVVAVSRVRASRSAAHLVSDSALGARERDGARSSEAPEPLSAVVTPVTAKPMPTGRQRQSLPSVAGG